MFAQDPGTGFTIWVTGMPLAGKHALAKAVTDRLKRIGKPAELIDGGEWEVFLGRAPGGTKEERNAITRRAGYFARMVTRAGGFAVIPQISPYREVREQLRREIGRFLEVFVDCPIETLIHRDTKGEYQRAMRGEIKDFIGVTDPYEPPASPEVKIDSSKLSADEGATLVLEALVREGVLQAADVGLARTPRKEKKTGGKKPLPPSILFTREMLIIPKVAPLPPRVETKPAAAKPATAKPATAKPATAKPATAKPATAKPATAKADAKAPAKVEGKPAAKAPAKVEGKPAAKAPAKVEGKPAAKAAAKVEGKPAAKVEGKPAAKVEGKPAAKAAAKVEGKPAAKAAAKVEGKVAAKVAAKPAAKAAGKVEAKPAAKVEAKVEAKPAAKKAPAAVKTAPIKSAAKTARAQAPAKK